MRVSSATDPSTYVPTKNRSPRRPVACVEIDDGAFARRPPRHRRARSMAWRCRFLAVDRASSAELCATIHPTHWLISTQVRATTPAPTAPKSVR